ncbi:Crp/Fnr family transcriptional regulator [Actinoplanes solisilvae]|uniref:Crp/Fnr family transcriptional regulator n=1 Tax=Actinoplanes solisilvae TaxID=2486853 RepID=UPI001F0BC690|nr:helix-turn-helix domain-containing protein [Actinoplanes solisilvae]
MTAHEDAEREGVALSKQPDRVGRVEPAGELVLRAPFADRVRPEDAAQPRPPRLRWSNRRRIDFTSYPVKTRLARILAELADLYGHRPGHGGVEIGVRLTQPELATLCGAAEISVHKALREMRHSRLVTTRYGRITVWDLARLRNSADMAPDQRRMDAY